MKQNRPFLTWRIALALLLLSSLAIAAMPQAKSEPDKFLSDFGVKPPKGSHWVIDFQTGDNAAYNPMTENLRLVDGNGTDLYFSSVRIRSLGDLQWSNESEFYMVTRTAWNDTHPRVVKITNLAPRRSPLFTPDDLDLVDRMMSVWCKDGDSLPFAGTVVPLFRADEFKEIARKLGEIDKEKSDVNFMDKSKIERLTKEIAEERLAILNRALVRWDQCLYDTFDYRQVKLTPQELNLVKRFRGAISLKPEDKSDLMALNRMLFLRIMKEFPGRRLGADPSSLLPVEDPEKYKAVASWDVSWDNPTFKIYTMTAGSSDRGVPAYVMDLNYSGVKMRQMTAEDAAIEPLDIRAPDYKEKPDRFLIIVNSKGKPIASVSKDTLDINWYQKD